MINIRGDMVHFEKKNLTDLFCCTVDVVDLFRLLPTTVNGCSRCFWTFCVGFLVFVVVGGGNVFCLVNSCSSLGVDFGCVAGGARVVIGFFVVVVVAGGGGGGVAVRVLFLLLRLRALDDVSTFWVCTINKS